MRDVLDPQVNGSVHPAVARAQQLVPLLRERIIETEELRRLPEATIQDGIDAELFSLLLPEALGGAGGGPREFVDVLRTLAQGDPSAAWTMSFFIAHGWMLARWPEAAQRKIFQGDGPVLVAVAANPPGRAERVEGGYRLSGRWGYCSGVLNANWVQLAAKIEGEEELRLFLIPRAEVEVPDTWYMAGMKGTGSNDVVVHDSFIPEVFSLELAAWLPRDNPGAALYPESTYAYDIRDLLVFLLPALLLGAGQALIGDYRHRLDTRRAAFDSTLTGDTVAGQLRYARAVSQLRAAEAVLDRAVRQTLEVNAASTESMSDELRANIKLDCLSVGRLVWEAIQLAMRGSGAAIYRTNDDTQHFLRDVEVILGHLTIDEDGMLERAGQVLLGRADGPSATRNFT
ncbi:acyl-CoA dehydrogenase family protein [Nocardia sp. NBC_01327]|uniref:acyl-CoA dehydrogenase family protein n=1 Tax=Nocardia sp. NBC_01327 TaxID=2903593 RepID=UPI002E1671C9|nr:hypothetical protein OG326_16065 [Nocardia sp. NBC_01327]